MKFELLSKNAIILVGEVLSNEDLIKLLVYNDGTPYDNPIIEHTGALVEDIVCTTPFAGDVPIEEGSVLRIFFSDGRINNRVILDSTVTFQIVSHKETWLMKDNEDEKRLRPYEIMNKIVQQFEDKSIGTLGVIRFTNYRYNHINSSWGMYTLNAKMMTI